MLTPNQKWLLSAAKEAMDLLEYREKGINRRFGPNAEIQIMRRLCQSIDAVEQEEAEASARLTFEQITAGR